jgi:hypothetical protein
LRGGARLFAIALILLVFGYPESARSQMINPFAGQMGVMGAMGPQNFAPYGAQSGAMAHIIQTENGLMMSSQSSIPNLMNGLSRLLGMEARGQMFPIEHDQMGMVEGLMGEVPGTATEGIEIERPEVEIGEGIIEVVVGSCAGGAFIGAFSVATAAPAAAPVAGAVAVAAAPLALTAFTTAMGIGCVLGVTTASVSIGAVLGYRGAT